MASAHPVEVLLHVLGTCRLVFGDQLLDTEQRMSEQGWVQPREGKNKEGPGHGPWWPRTTGGDWVLWSTGYDTLGIGRSGVSLQF